MKSLLTGNLVSRIDILIAKYLILAVAVPLGLALAISGAITIPMSLDYWETDFCFRSPGCYALFAEMITPQIEVIKVGGALSSLIVLVSGAYLAIRNYLATSQVGMLGNAISHVTFFERFVKSEVTRRSRLTTEHVDVFAIYELMFPRSHVNQRFADAQFVEAVEKVFAVIKESSRRYSSRKNEFRFDDHRRRLIEAFTGVYISMQPNARIDFLETEDEAIEFVVILCRVFAPPEHILVRPERAYR